MSLLNLAFTHLIPVHPPSMGVLTCLPQCQGLHRLHGSKTCLASRRTQPRGQCRKGHGFSSHCCPGQSLSKVQQFFREPTRPPSTGQLVSEIHFACDPSKVHFQGGTKCTAVTHPRAYLYFYFCQTITALRGPSVGRPPHHGAAACNSSMLKEKAAPTLPAQLTNLGPHNTPRWDNQRALMQRCSLCSTRGRDHRITNKQESTGN